MEEILTFGTTHAISDIIGRNVGCKIHVDTIIEVIGVGMIEVLAAAATSSSLGMTFDLGVRGEAKVTMKGYKQDALDGSGSTWPAASPAIDQLFDVRDIAHVTEEERAKFHSMVAKLLYLAKGTKPECLTAVSFDSGLNCNDISFWFQALHSPSIERMYEGWWLE